MPRVKGTPKRPKRQPQAGPSRPASVDALLRELDGLVERLAAESSQCGGTPEDRSLSDVALRAARWIITRRLLDLELAAKGTRVYPDDPPWRVEDAWIKAAIESDMPAGSASSAPKSHAVGTINPVAEESETYRAHLPMMLREHEGEFVLIKGREIVGFFPDDSSAIREGRRRFGVVEMLVKQVTAKERPVYIPNVVV